MSTRFLGIRALIGESIRAMDAATGRYETVILLVGSDCKADVLDALAADTIHRVRIMLADDFPEPRLIQKGRPPAFEREPWRSRGKGK